MAITTGNILLIKTFDVVFPVEVISIYKQRKNARLSEAHIRRKNAHTKIKHNTVLQLSVLIDEYPAILNIAGYDENTNILKIVTNKSIDDLEEGTVLNYHQIVEIVND